jgi:hypothetical protein
MPQYEARFITHSDAVFGSTNFEAEHDEAAKSHANRLLRTNIGKGHEIWHGDRLVHREIYK